MIGLSGAHRTGKTTLAREFAKTHNIPFLETSVSHAFKAAGRDPRIEYSIEERLAMQEVILLTLENQYKDASKVSRIWVADRTPMDLVMYTLADVTRTSLLGKPRLVELMDSYIHRCYASASRWFSTIVLVQPGIAASEKEGSAAFCPIYQEHLNALCLGAMIDDRLLCNHLMIERQYTGLEDRVKCLTHAVMHSTQKHQAKLHEAASAGPVNFH